ncbi:MAG TPA: type II toxin-antitoxin system RelE/ParE family toxin [Candidatus Desulfovibrio gallistercoris]|nr:type II toxin-antitoxin system RelE/ParE family toxin [Candidatus Desulfovibrio gallistercoris]
MRYLDNMYPSRYIFPMNILKFSPEFGQWLSTLRDVRGKVKILARLERAEQGNFGDVKPLGEGLCEMRVHHGPGYRIYYTQRGEIVYLLLVGGDKSSQARDIARARAMMEDD